MIVVRPLWVTNRHSQCDSGHRAYRDIEQVDSKRMLSPITDCGTPPGVGG